MRTQADIVERRSPGTWAGFFAWAVFGAATAFGTVSFPTLALLLIIIGGSIAAFRPAFRRSWIGAMTGAGALYLYVAYVQRHGTDLSPWPWLVVGAALFVSGLVVQAWRIHSRG